MTLLYFDCSSGAAGDMILGALIDVGLALADLQGALGSLAVDPATVWTERVTRAGVGATKFHVRGEAPPVDDGHHHGHAHHHPQGSMAPTSSIGHAHAPHRTLAEITHLIQRSALSERGKERAISLFDRLAKAEAAVHGTSVDRVHLHEVGALDSIIDVVGTVYAMEALGVDQVVASPLNVGGGTVRSAHGVLSVPAPATIRLLQGAPIYGGTEQVELVTPTGALLVTAYADRFGPIPGMTVERVGYGAGSRDFADRANVIRVLIGQADTVQAAQTVVVIEAEIDDMNPQIYGVLMDRLLAAGAFDVFYTPIQMKKNRPGTLLSIVAPPTARERLTATVFRESTTIGVRYREMARECLDRESLVVDTPYGAVTVKVARRAGEIMNVSPEFEDCVRLSTRSGRPVKDIHAAATRAFQDR